MDSSTGGLPQIYFCIDQTLTELVKGQTVTAIYYCQYAQEYRQLTGPVVKVDEFWKLLHIGKIAIDFSEIAELHPA